MNYLFVLKVTPAVPHRSGNFATQKATKGRPFTLRLDDRAQSAFFFHRDTTASLSYSFSVEAGTVSGGTFTPAATQPPQATDVTEWAWLRFGTVFDRSQEITTLVGTPGVSSSFDDGQGTPVDFPHQGTFRITVTLTDANDAKAAGSFILNSVLVPPELGTPIEVAPTTIGNAFNFTVPNTAFVGEDLSYAVTWDDPATVGSERGDTLPNYVSFTENADGSLTFAVTADAPVFEHQMRVTATNSGGSANSDFTLRIVDVAPSRRIAYVGRTVTAGREISFDIPAETFNGVKLDLNSDESPLDLDATWNNRDDNDDAYDDALADLQDANGMPWLTFVQNTDGSGTFTVAASAVPDTYLLRVTASNTGGPVHVDFVLTVEAETVPTVVTALPDVTREAGGPFEIAVPAGTFDGERLMIDATWNNLEDTDDAYDDALVDLQDANGMPWLTFVPNSDGSGTFSATADAPVGMVQLRVAATNPATAPTVTGVDPATSDFTLTVVAPTVPTVATALADVTREAGGPFEIAVPAGTFEGEYLEIDATWNNPEDGADDHDDDLADLPWLTFMPGADGSGTFSATADAPVGTVQLRVTATNPATAPTVTGVDPATSDFTLTVAAAAVPTVEIALPDVTREAGDPFEIAVPAGTFDGQYLMIEATWNDPDDTDTAYDDDLADLPWLTFVPGADGSGTFSATADAPADTYQLRVTAANPATEPTVSGVDPATSDFTLTVTAPAVPTVEIALPDVTREAGGPFEIPVPAGTFDGEHLTLTATWDDPDDDPDLGREADLSGLAWLTFVQNDDGSGTFSATADAPVDTYQLRVTATNPGTVAGGNPATSDFTLTVAAAAVPTVGTALPDVTGEAGSPFEIAVPAGTFVGEHLTLDATWNNPDEGDTAYDDALADLPWLTFMPGADGSGTFSATADAPVGMVQLRVTATNPATEAGGDPATSDFTLVVTDLAAPTPGTAFQPSGAVGTAFSFEFPRTAFVGALYSLSPTWNDPDDGDNARDDDIIELSWLSFADNGDGTGTFSTNGAAPLGAHELRVEATNAAGSGSVDFTLLVVEAPTAGSGIDPGTQAAGDFAIGVPAGAFTGVDLELSATYEADDDGMRDDDLSGLPWLAIVDDMSGDGAGAFMATAAPAGSYALRLTATNAAGSEHFDFTLLVVDAPEAGTGIDPGTRAAGDFTIEVPAGAFTGVDLELSATYAAGGDGVPDDDLSGLSWLTFDDGGSGDGTGTFTATGIPAESYDLRVTATNAAGSESFDFTLLVIDAPARGAAIGAVRRSTGDFTFDVPAGAFTGDDLTLTATWDDPDDTPDAGRTVALSGLVDETGRAWLALADGMSGDGTGTFTATGAPSGDYDLRVTATSDVGMAHSDFTLVVNAPPSETETAADRLSATFSNLAENTPTVGATWTQGFTLAQLHAAFDDADDSDADLTFGLATSGNPDWLSESMAFDGSVADDAVALEISGMPEASDFGPATVTIEARDSVGGTGTAMFEVTVNRPPAETGMLADRLGAVFPNPATNTPEAGAAWTQEFTLAQLRAAFTDPDGDALTFGLAGMESGNPSWLTTETVGTQDGDDDSVVALTVSGMPEEAADIDGATVTILASDGKGGTGTASFRLVGNAPPVETGTVAARLGAAFPSPATNTATVGVAWTQAFTLGQLRAAFSDPDGDVLTYRLASSGNPAWLAATPGVQTGADGSVVALTVSGTPMAEDAGDATVAIVADDSEGGTVRGIFTLPVNAPPVETDAMADRISEVFPSPDAGEPTIGAVWTQAFTLAQLHAAFEDPDGEDSGLTFGLAGAGSGNPSWLSESMAFDGSAAAGEAALEISGMPMAGDAGAATVWIAANDGEGGTATGMFALVVNAPPAETATMADRLSQVFSDTEANAPSVGADWTREISLGQLRAAFTDPEGDALAFGLAESGNPGWISAVAGTQAGTDGAAIALTLSGMPMAGDAGAATVSITADDRKGGTGTASFPITVNVPPAETATMADRLSEVFPNPAANVPTVGVTWRQDFTLAQLRAAFEDSDGADAGLTFRLAASGNPAWLSESMAFDADAAAGEAALEISGAPTTAGDATIVIEAEDRSGGTATGSFVVTVNAPPAETAVAAGQLRAVFPNPAANTPTAGVEWVQGFTLAQLRAAFDDADDADADLVFRLAPDGNPGWLSESMAFDGTVADDAVALEISGTPRAGDAGAAMVAIEADDGNGGTGRATFPVTVNAPPTETATLADRLGAVFPGTNAPVADMTWTQEFTLAQLRAAFTDPDGDALTFRLAGMGSGNPTWLTTETVGTQTGTDETVTALTVSGTVPSGAVGNVIVVIEADDMKGGKATASFAAAGEAAPVESGAVTARIGVAFPSPATNTPTVGVAWTQELTLGQLRAAFTDADGDDLTYSLAGTGSGNPGWLSGTAGTQTGTDDSVVALTLTGTPMATDAGAATVTIEAVEEDDATMKVAASFDLVVNVPPMETETATAQLDAVFPTEMANVGDEWTQGFTLAQLHAAFDDGDDEDADLKFRLAGTGSGNPLWLEESMAFDGTVNADAVALAISGTPQAGDAGDVAVTIEADDGKQDGTGTAMFTLTVNGPPMETGTAADRLDMVFPTVMATVGEEWTQGFTVAQLDAAFVDSDSTAATLTYRLAESGNPLWLEESMAFDRNAAAGAVALVISGEPTEAGDATVTIEASDGAGGTGTAMFTLPVNAPPTETATAADRLMAVFPQPASNVAGVGAAWTQEFTLAQLRAAFDDPDGTDAALTFRLAGPESGNPLWLTGRAGTQTGTDETVTALTISGTPMAADVGTATVAIVADDTQGGTAIGTFALTVVDAPAPGAAIAVEPQVAGSSFAFDIPAGAFSGGALTFEATWDDPDDSPDAGRTVALSGLVDENGRAWLAVSDDGSGTITATDAPAGSYDLRVTATNAASNAANPAMQDFTLVVVDNPAVGMSVAVGTQAAGDFTLAVPAGSFTGDALTLSATWDDPEDGVDERNAPLSGLVWLSFADGASGDGTGTFTATGIPLGRYDLRVTATNAAGSASQEFSLEVAGQPAVGAPIPDTTLASGDFALAVPAGSFTGGALTLEAFYASEADGDNVPDDPLTGLSWLSFDDDGSGFGTGTFTATGAPAGTYRLRVTATNAVDSASQDFTLVLVDAPMRGAAFPVGQQTAGDFSFGVPAGAFSGSDLTLEAFYAADDDGVLDDDLSGLSWLSFADGGSGDGTGTFTATGAPVANQALRLTATNSLGSASWDFTLMVLAAGENLRPVANTDTIGVTEDAVSGQVDVLDNDTDDGPRTELAVTSYSVASDTTPRELVAESAVDVSDGASVEGTYGRLSIDAQGLATYTLLPGARELAASAMDVFAYAISDGASPAPGMAVGVIEVTIRADDDGLRVGTAIARRVFDASGLADGETLPISVTVPADAFVDAETGRAPANIRYEASVMADTDDDGTLESVPLPEDTPVASTFLLFDPDPAMRVISGNAPADGGSYMVTVTAFVAEDDGNGGENRTQEVSFTFELVVVGRVQDDPDPIGTMAISSVSWSVIDAIRAGISGGSGTTVSFGAPDGSGPVVDIDAGSMLEHLHGGLERGQSWDAPDARAHRAHSARSVGDRGVVGMGGAAGGARDIAVAFGEMLDSGGLGGGARAGFEAGSGAESGGSAIRIWANAGRGQAQGRELDRAAPAGFSAESDESETLGLGVDIDLGDGIGVGVALARNSTEARFATSGEPGNGVRAKNRTGTEQTLVSPYMSVARDRVRHWGAVGIGRGALAFSGATAGAMSSGAPAGGSATETEDGSALSMQIAAFGSDYVLAAPGRFEATGRIEAMSSRMTLDAGRNDTYSRQDAELRGLRGELELGLPARIGTAAIRPSLSLGYRQESGRAAVAARGTIPGRTLSLDARAYDLGGAATLDTRHATAEFGFLSSVRGEGGAAGAAGYRASATHDRDRDGLGAVLALTATAGRGAESGMDPFSSAALDRAAATGSGTGGDIAVTARLGYGVDRGRDNRLSVYARTGGTEVTLGLERESAPGSVGLTYRMATGASRSIGGLGAPGRRGALGIDLDFRF